jgi:hypothetical protein
MGDRHPPDSRREPVPVFRPRFPAPSSGLGSSSPAGRGAAPSPRSAGPMGAGGFQWRLGSAHPSTALGQARLPVGPHPTGQKGTFCSFGLPPLVGNESESGRAKIAPKGRKDIAGGKRARERRPRRRSPKRGEPRRGETSVPSGEVLSPLRGSGEVRGRLPGASLEDSLAPGYVLLSLRDF